MNNRRRLTGVVTSDKMTKTVVVQVVRTYQHPLYKKVVHDTNRYKAHDELGAKTGDEVVIVESRPISREKHWVVESIVRRLGETTILAEVVNADIAAVEAVEAAAEEAEAVEAEAEAEPVDAEAAEADTAEGA